nr:MAG TPA: hypothetical protein [Caudoviricetes sp.]
MADHLLAEDSPILLCRLSFHIIRLTVMRRAK